MTRQALFSYLSAVFPLAFSLAFLHFKADFRGMKPESGGIKFETVKTAGAVENAEKNKKIPKLQWLRDFTKSGAREET